mmetsp:Transcript_8960/g.20184  ORF Transcript_8960/g.20184 Transcript_8960/m.20184 type:complete len:444 (+) Transcript_8960:265-1596(+)|eukprot:CAMPEP_0172313130 /NCGR_PEP_ID=MMETSP1058-20130122/19502_1 /TAXON_ID=83371 /ORGANISM="Detonula confervacea, Strain CCMP 353" /LENGTH=443 /DNA_ID=CAMNT_0013026735 /DNA_START=195 /DNA_END=1526 /DNA_ORIENTATION=+
MGFIKKMKSSRSMSSKSMTKQKSKKSKQSKSQPVTPESPIGDNAGRHVSLVSLGTGSFSASGVFSITVSSNGRSPSPHSYSTESIESLSDGEGSLDDGKEHNHRLRNAAASKLSPIKEVLVSHIMPSRVFIRTADLPHMESAVAKSRHASFSDLAEDEWIDHVHKPSSNPPFSSMEHDSNESWVALDDGNGNKAPLAEAAMAALVKAGLDASLDKGMWTANGGTAKILKTGIWNETIFLPYDESISVPVPHAKGSKGENDVLVWSGTFSHTYYGSDLPTIRCEAIVNMSPKALANLLVDSNRVKEYNKMSVGRDDIMVLREDEKCVTKIIVGKSKPPMLGKTLVLKSLLHMEELPGGGEQSGYVIASRAIAHAGDTEAVVDPKEIHSEMLMGLNIIRAVEGEPDRCILINLNHLSSPMIPMMFAKRLGLSAAVNFINDIRALC